MTSAHLKAGKVKAKLASWFRPVGQSQTRTLVARVQLAGDVQANNDVTTGEGHNGGVTSPDDACHRPVRHALERKGR